MDDMTLGYDDRLLGAMEMPLCEFVPMTEGGELPMHRVWYVRNGELVLWDRKRKLDLVFGSGMTSAIVASGVDTIIGEETARRIKDSRDNLEKVEEERQHRLDVQLHALRHAEARAAGTLPCPKSTASRSGLIRAVFNLCDTDGDKVLSAGEMCVFAKHAGFDGSDDEWESEFRLLCSEHMIATDAGVDAAVFEKLLNDTSEDGCYCEDNELHQIAADIRHLRRSQAR